MTTLTGHQALSLLLLLPVPFHPAKQSSFRPKLLASYAISVVEKSASLPQNFAGPNCAFGSPCQFRKGTRFTRAAENRTERRSALPEQRRRARSEATDSIAVVLAIIFLLPFSAQKSHVKPLNHLTHSQPTTSAWHFSYPPSAIIKTVE